MVSTHRVSVVIPCYNQAHFLGQAIDSLLAQTRPPFEIVVVDDGSTDNTVAVAQAYPAVRTVSQPNQGQGAARNTGLTYVSSEFVVFLDSDDRLLPQAFEIGLRYFAAHPEAAFVAGRCLVLAPDGRPREIRRDPVVETDHYRRLLATNYIWMPGTVIFRTALVREVGGFKTNVSGAEDYDLYLRIARHHPIRCHDQTVAEYRQHETSTSAKPMLMIRAALAVARAQLPAVKGDPLGQRVLRQGIRHWQELYGERAITLVRKQLRAHQWRLVLPTLFGLLHHYPGGLFRHGCRKLYRVARGNKPEPLDAIGTEE